MSEAHVQAIVPSPILRSVEPSPWEALSYHLTSAILAVGIKYSSLRHIVYDCTIRFALNSLEKVETWCTKKYDSDGFESSFNDDENFEIAALAVSLLGFMEAISIHTHFYTVLERQDVVNLLRIIMSENFMVSVEGAFSAIRTSDATSDDVLTWKIFTNRYAALGRPLGAMLLQRGFMRFLLSCSSLQILRPEQLQRADIYELLTSEEHLARDEKDLAAASLLKILLDIAIEEMRLIEDGADYLQLGSAWQQQLAFTVKAHTLTIFLNCVISNEEIADIETLMTWLEDAMADPTQMADSTLACAVLKSMAVLARFSSSVASTLGRTLPRFIVQGGLQGEIITVAARSLTYILQTLSQDAIITGLYSLGNVLSARSRADKLPEVALAVPQFAGRFSQHSTGSAISLDLSGEEEIAVVYGNIVRAIVDIATVCKDENITALALSMLLQKLGRVSLAVDLHIITETAILAISGGPQELKLLLKLYTKISHDAVIQGNDTLLEAVRVNPISPC